MILLPLALLLAAASSHLVLDDIVEVPPAEWRYIDITAKEPMAVVNCEFQVVSENSPVRAVWIPRASLESFKSGRRRNVLAATPFAMDGKLRHVAPDTGDYALVLENQLKSRTPVKVKVRIWLESAVSPKELSPQRRLVVILISVVAFFAMVSFSAFKLRSQL